LSLKINFEVKITIFKLNLLNIVYSIHEQAEELFASARQNAEWRYAYYKSLAEIEYKKKLKIKIVKTIVFF